MRSTMFVLVLVLLSVQLVDMKNKRLLSALQLGRKICLPGSLLENLLATQPQPLPPDCGPAPEICGASVTYDQTYRPTRATYSCTNDSDDEVSSDSEDSFCSRSGVWTSVSLKCLGLVYLPESQTQPQGAEKCKGIGRTLLNIQRAQQTRVINDFMDDNSVSIGAWTGLEYDTTRKQFLWPDNRTFNNEDVWDVGDPDNLGQHNCVLKIQENKGLETLACSRLFSVLCSC